MKWLFIIQSAPSGAANILRSLDKELRALGDEVTTYCTGPIQCIAALPARAVWEGADAVHFLSGDVVPTFLRCVEKAGWDDREFGITIHGWCEPSFLQAKYYLKVLHEHRPGWIHVMDGYTEQSLALAGFYSFRTGQPVWTVPYHHLPYPAEPLVGFIGSDPKNKRFDVIEAICERVGVPCDGRRILGPADLLDEAGMLAFYEGISIFAQAAFGGCGTLPAQEALLCGRPVLTTRIDPIGSLVRPGLNGETFDGSVADGVWKLRRILTTEAHYRAHMLPAPDQGKIAALFRSEVQERLEAAE